MEIERKITELSARLSVHEFLLEQVFAKTFLANPDSLMRWDRVSEEIIDAFKLRAYGTSDQDDIEQLQERSIAIAQSFCTKVRERVISGT